MKNVCVATLVALCCAGFVSAADLQLTFVPDGFACGESYAGGPFNYTITGDLTGSTYGLALFGFDMVVPGFDLSTVATVNAGSTDVSDHFVYPWGLNNPLTPGANPDAFGGVPKDDGSGGMKLVQIGGGQNTINNDVSYAPAPVGAVDDMYGVGAQVVLASGTLDLGAIEDTYTVSLADGFANVITGAADPVTGAYPTEAAVVLGGDCAITILSSVDELIDSAVSCRDHGGTPVCMPLPTGTVEPRIGGVLQVALTMQGPVTTIDADVTCANAGAYTGTVTVGVAGTEVTLDFSPALPDEDCCTIALSGDSTDTWAVRTLQGDVDQNGSTLGSDMLAVKPNIGGTLDGSTAQYDVDVSGSILGSDMLAVKPYIGGSAPACP